MNYVEPTPIEFEDIPEAFIRAYRYQLSTLARGSSGFTGIGRFAFRTTHSSRLLSVELLSPSVPDNPFDSVEEPIKFGVDRKFWHRPYVQPIRDIHKSPVAMNIRCEEILVVRPLGSDDKSRIIEHSLLLRAAEMREKLASRVEAA